MEEKGIHYRTGGNLTHAGCEMLPEGKDIEYIVIERIEYKAEEKVNGRKELGVWLAHFAPNPYTKLPMILNATNRKRIDKLYRECNGYINRLKNVPVRLTREVCRDVQDGGETYGLRISKLPPTLPKKPVLNKKHANWSKCVDWLKGGGDLESLKAKYDISADIEKDLITEATSK